MNEIFVLFFVEEECVKVFLDMMKEIGVDFVWIDEVGNVIVLCKGIKGKKIVVLDVYLDMVFLEGMDVKVKV